MERIKFRIEKLLDVWKWHSSTEAKYRCEVYKELLDFINSLQEEPVSKDLEEAAKNHKSAIHIVSPQWTSEVEKAFIAGAQWQKEQFEKNRLEHCDSITEEQYNLECGFIDQYLEKYHRMPTFLDAIEYGMKKQREITYESM